MNILFAASELAPYAKTGGLGDVIASLPLALHQDGHHVSIAIPLYRAIRQQFKGLVKSDLKLSVYMGEHPLTVSVWQGKIPKGPIVFALQRDEFFDREHLYGNEDGDYLDNPARFAFFSRAVVELAKHIEPQIDIIHANDWHTALIPAYVRAWSLPFQTVLTIHNLAFQGSFPNWVFPETNLPQEYFSPAGVEFYGNVNFLKGGIMLAHAVTTVSPTYAKEIQNEQNGFGLHAVLQANRYKLTGMLNGMDTLLWNPATDPHIAKNYDLKHLAEKNHCKTALLKALKFKNPDDRPLFGVITRLVNQKGMDILLLAMDEFFKKNARLVILGAGDPQYETAFQNLSKKYPDRLKVKIGFDEPLAHKIQAGCDIFLMPSRYEPSGLTQLYALRYGTIPIVRDTGGLSDSVTQWDGVLGTGFKFQDYTPAALLSAVDAALAAFADKPQWQKLQRNAMTQDFSWKHCMKDYEKFYETLCAKPKTS